jgi:hypothetical protein
MSGTASTVSAPAPSPVKDAIDAYSGRFEFLKQTLTLGSAGIAGMAALFTDPTRVPTDTFSKWVVSSAGLSLILIVAFAAMGLSAYANFLTELSRDARLIDTENVSSNSKVYARGVIGHSQVIIIGLFLVWGSLTFFAGIKLFAPFSTSADTALTIARTIASKETGQPPQSLYLARLDIENDDFVAIYDANAVQSQITIRVSKKDGTVTKVVQDKKIVPSAVHGEKQ